MIPESTLCYVAYPIDNRNVLQFGGRPFLHYVEAVKAVISRHFDVTFDPGDAFSVSNLMVVGSHIGMINRFAAETADAVIAVLPRHGMSVGVPMEIETSVNAGKLTIVLTDIENSFMLTRPEHNLMVIPVRPDEDSIEALGIVLNSLVMDAFSKPNYKDITFGRTAMGFKQLGIHGQLPSQSHFNDAGLDLYVSQKTVVEPGQFVDVPFDVAAELPRGTWGMLVGRSSTLRRRGLLVATGIIDEGYRGPLYGGVQNLSATESVTLEIGERIAQLIVLPNFSMGVEPVWVAELSESERGDGGFGSTGS